MTMAVPVRILRANDMPRSCRDAAGVPKVLFQERAHARRAARLHRHGSPGLSAYPCGYCPGYHIGVKRTETKVDRIAAVERVEGLR